MADIQEDTLDHATLCSSCGTVFADLTAVAISVRERFLRKIAGFPPNINRDGCRLCFDINSTILKSMQNTENAQLNPPVQFEVIYQWIRINDKIHQDLIITIYTLNPKDGLRSTELDSNLFYELVPGSERDGARSLYQDHIPEYSGSNRSIEFLRSQLLACQLSHTRCKLNASESWYPSRLLAIDLTNDSVRLCDSHNLHRPAYFSLSHCWGGALSLMLTKTTEPRLRAGISITNMPKTFADACFVTATMSISYIWIDALCIFQDDLEDWSKQALDMQKVYSGAICNIAATSGSNSSSGLFWSRDPRVKCPFLVKIPDRPDSEDDTKHQTTCWLVPMPWLRVELDEAPLNKRAWVLQERILSPRVMHFSNRQLYWECLEDVSAESHRHVSVGTVVESMYQVKRELSKYNPEEKQSGMPGLYNLWGAIVNKYAACGLTKEADKLIAMDGIMKVFSKRSEDFTYGMYMPNLVKELCWHRFELKPETSQKTYPEVWRAPSWSWASVNVGRRYSPVFLHDDCAERQTRIYWESVQLNSSGPEVDGCARLVLRGKVLHMNVSKGSDESELPRLHCGDGSLLGQRHFLEIVWDDKNMEAEVKCQVACLAVMSCSCTTWGRTVYALMLRESSLKQGEYERMGLIKVVNNGYDFYVEHEEKEEISITII